MDKTLIEQLGPEAWASLQRNAITKEIIRNCHVKDLTLAEVFLIATHFGYTEEEMIKLLIS